MHANRPDTNQALGKFRDAILFDHAKISRPGELIQCDVATFGRDFAVGKPKQCFCEKAPQHPHADGRKCATEGGNCNCEAGKVVLYGQNHSVKRNKSQIARWYEIFQVKGGKGWTGKQVTDKTSIPCNNKEFGDPLHGIQKACFCVKETKHVTDKLKKIGKYIEAAKKEEEAKEVKANAVQKVAAIQR